MSTTTTNLLTELPAELRDPMRRIANRGLMVRFINADLIARASLDVRRSVVLYDADGLFEYAVDTLPAASIQASLIERTAVRHYSIGI